MIKDTRIYRSLAAAKNEFFRKTKKNLPEAPTKPRNNSVKFSEIIPEKLLNPDPRTIDDLNKAFCSGCGGCYNVCPTDAISMTFDKQGFLTPVISADKCVNCSKCAKACPVINTQYKNTDSPDCFAVMADNEIREKSSSGGIFTLAAEYILENGGYVCGAALTEDFSVRHILISEKKDLDRLRGSKYAQSDTGKIFTEIKKLLDDKKTVLFSGCPCQVGGLYGFLGKDYENLYTLDLVCHGAPSQKMFIRYLDEFYGRENLADFKFRTKEYGYNSFHQIAYLKNGDKAAKNIKFDPYERAMHSGLTLREICADCSFASAPRQGDISIGDFWGISKHKKELNDNLGTSVTLLNNDKGRKLFDKIRDKAKLVEEVPFDFARVNNRFGKKMNIPRNGRMWFYNMIKGQSFEKSVDYALRRKFDIGIIGLWYGRNYGSMATYYALHQVLVNHFSLSVLMIDNPLAPQNIELTKTHPYTFANQYYDISCKYPINDLQVLNNFCDTFIVGSDQLWNVHLSRPYRQMYFLDFVNDNKKRIAYGTSLGIKYVGTPEELLLSSHNLRKFDHISVRDELSLDFIRNECDIDDVVTVCDPTLLCDSKEYDPLIARAGINETEDYILAYVLDPNPQIGRELDNLAKEKNCKIIVLLDELPWKWEPNVARLELPENSRIEIKREIDLFEWLWYYSHAKAVVTDSFHGTIFSIIFKKPFISITNVVRGAKRFVSLLTPLELSYRLFNAPEDIGKNSALLDSIDYTVPYAKLNDIRKQSMKWLENALFSQKEFTNNCIYPVCDKRFNK